METTNAMPQARRFTLPLSDADHELLARRAAEEGMPRTTHLRRLIRQDAAAHTSTGDSAAPETAGVMS